MLSCQVLGTFSVSLTPSSQAQIIPWPIWQLGLLLWASSPIYKMVGMLISPTLWDLWENPCKPYTIDMNHYSPWLYVQLLFLTGV